MSNFIVNTDIPNLRVVIREGDQYNINIIPGRITTQVTGSFTSYADMAGMAASASYVSGAGVIAQFATSASYAVTSSHANANLLTASVAGNILTFTKGNNESFSVALSTGSVDSASFATTASYAQTINRQITGSVVISDDLTVQGIISAEKLLVSSSVIYESGSTKFGDSLDDTHQFTGSVSIQGPLNASSITGSIYLEPVTESYAFQIPFVSESSGRAESTLAVDASRHLTFNPSTHVLQISGGIGNAGGITQLSPQGVTFSSGSNFAGVIEKFGVINTIDNKTIAITADPSQLNLALENNTNPGIYVTSGTLQSTGYVPLEFQGSGSYTDGRVTINTPLDTKQGIYTTGSVTATEGFTGSLYGTASVADGIDVVIAGIYETGSDGVIIPAPSGGYTYISTASYALTASYIANNTWGNLLNIPTGLLSSSVQVYPLPVESSSYALTASYAMNGGGGAGSSGTSGTAGSSGTSGTAGSSGTSGNSGTAGSSGTSGETPSIPTGTVSSSVQLTALGFVSSSTINTIQTITSASYAGITPVSGTLYIIID